jgi:hypothetical protein
MACRWEEIGRKHVNIFIIRQDWRYQRINQKPQFQDGHHNDQNEKDKRTNNGLQSITQQTKDQATRNTLRLESERRCFRMCSEQ